MTEIKDKLFDVSCPSWRDDSTGVLDKLAVRRDEDPFSALKRNGWDGESGVVSMITTIDPNTKMVAGTRYVTAGRLIDFEGRPTNLGGFAGIKAKNGAGLRLRFTVRGEMIKWPETEGHRNVTEYVPLANLDAGIEWKDKDGALSKIRLAEKWKLDADDFATNLTLRFTLQHSKELGAMRLSCSALFRQPEILPDWLEGAKPSVVPGIPFKPKGSDGIWTEVAWAPIEGNTTHFTAMRHTAIWLL